MRMLSLITAALLVVPALPLEAEKKSKKQRGRYLELVEGVDLGEFHHALVILEAAEITAGKNKPKATEEVRSASDAILHQRLEDSGLFAGVVDEIPYVGPGDPPVLRLSPELDLKYGSRALRFWVGFGAGKSKLHIKVHLYDARDGRYLGYFNGFGAGSGAWAMTGGKTTNMAKGDLQKNYRRLAELLAGEVHDGTPGGPKLADADSGSRHSRR